MAEKDSYLKIGRPHNACETCGTAIAHAGKHPSLLRKAAPTGKGQVNAEGPQREDYCAACWQELAKQDFVGYWVTRREAPKVRKIETKKERNAALASWFEHLRMQDADDEIRQSLFFLSHLLMKYGVLKWQRTETANDKSETVIFRQQGSDDEIAVFVVDVTDERSVEIKRELDEFLLHYANAQPASDDAISVDGIADAEGADST